MSQTMTTTKFDISIYEPCKDAIKYYGTKKSFEQAWNDCPRGDWMLWIAARLSIDRKLLVLSAVRCARTVQDLMTDERSLKALDVAEMWATTERVTDQELKGSANAAWAAAWASRATDAAAATYAAAYATLAAADATWVASSAFAAALAANQKQVADICRELLTDAVFEIVNQKNQ